MSGFKAFGNKKPCLDSWCAAPHTTLRATNVDRQIVRLEEIAALKGVRIKGNENEIRLALQSQAGLCTNDEDIFALSKLYLFTARSLGFPARLPFAEISVLRYFFFSEVAEQVHSRLTGGPMPLSDSPVLRLFDVIANKKKDNRGVKPVFHLLIRWETEQVAEAAELTELLDFLRSLVITKDAKLLIFAARLDDLPQGLRASLAVINPGGYFS